MKLVDEQMLYIAAKGTIPVDNNGVMPLERYVDLQRCAITILT
jgi:hypothetical protein